MNNFLPNKLIHQQSFVPSTVHTGSSTAWPIQQNTGNKPYWSFTGCSCISRGALRIHFTMDNCKARPEASRLSRQVLPLPLFHLQRLPLTRWELPERSAVLLYQLLHRGHGKVEIIFKALIVCKRVFPLLYKMVLTDDTGVLPVRFSIFLVIFLLPAYRNYHDDTLEE